MHYTTIGLGGPIRTVIHATTDHDLIRSKPDLILGGGSNVVLPDEGIDGTVALVRTRGIDARNGLYTVAAGELWDELVARTVDDGYSGLEAMSGIPGTVGGTPVQNVGAYGQQVSDTLTHVRVYDTHSQTIKYLLNRDCRFTYRNSIFRQSSRYIILDVAFQLTKTPHRSTYPSISHIVGTQAIRTKVLELRRQKGMLPGQFLSAGSFFKNPSQQVHAAKLIEHAGYVRGHIHKGVGISPLHSLALINRGTGTTQQLLELASEISARVAVTSCVHLEIEPIIIIR